MACKLELIRRIDEITYQESIRERKEKIKRKLQAEPGPDLARRIQKNLGIPHDLDAYLERIDSPLSRLQVYRPISEMLVRDTIRSVIESNVIASYSDATGAKFPLVISTSLVNRGSKQVFWDIVSPALKFEGLARNS